MHGQQNITIYFTYILQSSLMFPRHLQGVDTKIS